MKYLLLPRGENGELFLNEYRIFVGNDEKALCIEIVEYVTQHCECI